VPCLTIVKLGKKLIIISNKIKRLL